MMDAQEPNLPQLPGLALADGETLRVVFRPDLDEQLRYATGVVALTSSRICWQTRNAAWKSVRLSPSLRLHHREYSGLGELRLSDGTRTLARFFHTLAVGEGATQILDAFQVQPGAAKSRPRPVSPVDEQDSSDLPVSGKFPLVRLMRFARPHLGAVLFGLGLTLASTAAGLIPPYLTMPLVDQVLVPGQAGQLTLQAALPKVLLYLGGLAAPRLWLGS
jgi:ATP-binding cassette subfamily B protein